MLYLVIESRIELDFGKANDRSLTKVRDVFIKPSRADL